MTCFSYAPSIQQQLSSIAFMTSRVLLYVRSLYTVTRPSTAVWTFAVDSNSSHMMPVEMSYTAYICVLKVNKLKKWTFRRLSTWHIIHKTMHCKSAMTWNYLVHNVLLSRLLRDIVLYSCYESTCQLSKFLIALLPNWLMFLLSALGWLISETLRM